MSNAENNKRIAKNTALLYVRMLFIMAVTLYTSRVVLDVLGVEDFGIYNVVGGVVAMLSFLNGSLSTATQRYMNYEMGKGNADGLRKVFSMSFFSFCLLGVVAVVLAESVGLWFVYEKLVIPPERMEASVWVFHFSVLTFLVNLLTVPYQSAIIAHERMSIYAYLSVIEVVAKLLMVYVLEWVSVDKLWLYGLLMFLVTLSLSTAYRLCCSRLFEECHVHWLWDRGLLKGLFSFSGWMLAGTVTSVVSMQGVTMLINMFFGPVLNASRAVAMQIYGAVNTFSANFLTATRPQIVKSYAQGDLSYMYHLVFSASKFSFYLLFVLSLPLSLNVEWLLGIWLKEVPPDTALFTRLVLVDLLILASYNPIAYISQASGKVRDYQLSISICFLAIPVLTWIAYRLGFPVYVTFVIAIVVDFIGLFLRMWVLRRVVSFPVCVYLRRVWVPIVCVLTVSLLVSLSVPFGWLPGRTLSALVSVVWCVAVSCVSIWLLGLDAGEKSMISKAVRKLLNKRVK